MAITRWRPFRDLVSLQDEMNRLFDDFFARPLVRPEWPEGAWSPSVDVSENKDNVITLKGEKKQEKEEKSASYYITERSFGSFQRYLRLPDTVDDSKVEARFEKGVLKVTAAKKPEAVKAERRIEIKKT
jgi:HSP20 family protein